MQETQFRSQGREDPLKEMTTHSSIPAWEIPWTEEPGGLQPKVSVLLSVFMSFFLFFKIFIYLAAPDLSCSLWDLVPWPGIELRPPASGVHVYIYHTFIICSSIDGHLGCFLTLRKWFLDFDSSVAGLVFTSIASQLVWVNVFLTRLWLLWKRFRMSLLLNVPTWGQHRATPTLGQTGQKG